MIGFPRTACLRQRRVLSTHCMLLALSALSLPAIAYAEDDEENGNTLLLGAGVALETKYPGSERDRASAAIAVDYSMANGFFASTLRGLGWGGDVGSFTYSAALAYRDERVDKDDGDSFFGGFGSSGGDELRGMGRIDGSVLARWLGVSLTVEAPLSNTETGRAYHLGLGSTVYSSDRHEISVNLGGHAGDRDYMQTYYGVTAAQSVASGFRTHTPKAGFYAVSSSVDWTYQLNQNWGIHTSVGGEKLLGKAADSPIVRRKHVPSAMAMVTYTF
jgi:outer membrane scaffolding protein for murein synthesis (MipA/OmpV family)